MKSDFAPETASRVSLGQSADFDLGGMRVMPSRRQIGFGGATRTLEPRVMQVLVALAANRPTVVSRDQIALSCWGGLNTGDDAINRCIVSLRRLAREFDPEPFTIETVARVGYSLHESERADGGAGKTWRGVKTAWRGMIIPLIVIGAFAVIGLLAWHPWRRSTIVSVAVMSASATPESNDLARDLTAKLGMLSSVSEGQARLLDGASGDHADLRFRVDASAQGGRVEVGIVLLNDRSEVLWSKDFWPPRTNPPDLRQQLAFTAGKVLQCSLETMQAGGPQLGRQTVKLYLNGCAARTDANEYSLRDLDTLFEQVTRAAPAFRPGWRNLLMVEADILDADDQSQSDVAHARRVIAGARKADAAMPQIKIVQAGVLPTRAVAARMRLVDQAVGEAPDDGNMAQIHALYLNKVGRTHEAVDAARRAVQIDPLSPANRQALIVELGIAGRLAEAREELRQAELLWPGSLTLREARYLLYLRFADPREAIHLRDSGVSMPSASPFQGSFLTARANPTPANVEVALRDARAFYARNWHSISHLAQTLGEFGREDELFAILLNWDHPDGSDVVLDVLFRPPLRRFRHDPRFMRVAARLGVLDYWRSSGKWPDFCFATDLPYNCEREAAAIANHLGQENGAAGED